MDLQSVSEKTGAIGFHDVYAKYSKDIYRYSLYLSGNASMAEDLTAETFLRMWQGHGLDRAANVKAYLLTIVRNLYLHELRHVRRTSPLVGVTSQAVSPSRELEKREELRIVLAELAKLPEVDRSALLLRVNDGLPYDQIARILRISIAAAKVKVHRARMRLSRVRTGSAK